MSVAERGNRRRCAPTDAGCSALGRPPRFPYESDARSPRGRRPLVERQRRPDLRQGCAPTLAVPCSPPFSDGAPAVGSPRGRDNTGQPADPGPDSRRRGDDPGGGAGHPRPGPACRGGRRGKRRARGRRAHPQASAGRGPAGHPDARPGRADGSGAPPPGVDGGRCDHADDLWAGRVRHPRPGRGCRRLPAEGGRPERTPQRGTGGRSRRGLSVPAGRRPGHRRAARAPGGTPPPLTGAAHGTGARGAGRTRDGAVQRGDREPAGTSSRAR